VQTCPGEKGPFGELLQCFDWVLLLVPVSPVFAAAGISEKCGQKQK